METSELVKKVKKIEIKAKGKSNDIFSGAYHTAFKGRGMSFSETRAYQYGDDIRNIDWNVTARTGDPYVKMFEEERELTILLLIDVSRSLLFGSNALKKDFVTELSAVLALNALNNNDKVGAILFADKVIKYIPPKKGRRAALQIIRELINTNAITQNEPTNISNAINYFYSLQKKKCIAFVLSDFIAENYKDSMIVASKKHDLIPIKIWDEYEIELPHIGLVTLKDTERNIYKTIDTGSTLLKKVLQQNTEQTEKYFSEIIRKSGIKPIKLKTSDDYIKALLKYFMKR